MSTTLIADLPAEFANGTVLCRRATVGTVEVDARELDLRLLPYGVEAEIAPRLHEVFAPKAFARATKDPGRTKVYLGHSDVGGSLIGHALALEDREDGLYGRFRVARTRSADEALALVEAGTLTEASVEFLPVPAAMRVQRRDDGSTLVTHVRAALRGVALVPHGAYPEAGVLAMRDERQDRAREQAVARLRALTA